MAAGEGPANDPNRRENMEAMVGNGAPIGGESRGIEGNRGEVGKMKEGKTDFKSLIKQPDF